MDNTKIIIDIGTKNIRIGNNDNEVPIKTVHNLIGRSNIPIKMIGVERKDYYACSEIDYVNQLTITSPMNRGKVINWDDMEKVLSSVFYSELNIAPEEFPIFLTEQFNTSKEDHNKLTEIIFESFYVPSTCIMNQSILSFYSSLLNRFDYNSSGLIVDVGDSITSVVPIENGKIIKESVIYKEFGGLDICNNLNQYFTNNNSINDLSSKTLYDIKEKYGYVLNSNSYNSNEIIKYKLPDNRIIEFDNGIVGKMCGESLFKINDSEGINTLINKSINNDGNINKILLSGGSTKFNGLVERLSKEFKSMQVVNNNNDNSSWIGAKLISSLSSFNSNWTTLDDYNEYGVSK